MDAVSASVVSGTSSLSRIQSVPTPSLTAGAEFRHDDESEEGSGTDLEDANGD